MSVFNLFLRLTILFHFISLYLHDARVQLLHQGEDAVLQLQGQPHRQTGEPAGAGNNKEGEYRANIL